MYGIFAYIGVFSGFNVGIHSIHGVFGYALYMLGLESQAAAH